MQELKGFRRIRLGPGERSRVTFPLTREHFGFYNRDMRWVVEPGEFRIRASNSSVGGLTARLEVR